MLTQKLEIAAYFDMKIEDIFIYKEKDEKNKIVQLGILLLGALPLMHRFG